MKNTHHVSKKSIIILEVAAFLLASVVLVIPMIVLESGSVAWWAVLLSVAGVCALFAFWYIPAWWYSIRYAVTDHVIFYQKGVLFRTTQVMRREQVLFVSLVRDPFTPIFGTCSVMVSGAGASMVISFLRLEEGRKIVESLSPEGLADLS